ncbi:MAG: hypothetical protein RLZZ347_39 [Candidatus Parcubacteria bacterium]
MKVKIFRELARITDGGLSIIDDDIENRMSEFVQTVNVKSIHQTQTSTASPHQDGCLYVTTVFSVWYEEIPSYNKNLDLSVSVLNIDPRTMNCLASRKLSTLRLVCAKTENDYLEFRPFGVNKVKKLNQELARFGLRIGMSAKELAD